MEQNSTANRLHALDGLRGFAMILVFLNHVNPQFINSAFPILDKLGLFSSGTLGVSFFFILSGFLMTYLYPVVGDKVAFWQKRYTRIFPPYTTMCAALLFIQLNQSTPWYIRLLSIIGFALVANIIWVKIIKKLDSFKLSRGIFWIFVALQFIVGVAYALWIMRHPPNYLSEVIPEIAKFSLIGLVNATLTFPLGNYISMLDGAYWSLASEILFYILYPIIVIPIVMVLSKQNRLFKILFVISLLPFIAALNILSYKTLSLHTLQISLFYNFCGGILLGYLYRTRPKIFQGFSKLFSGNFFLLPLLFFFFTIVVGHLLDSVMPPNFSGWSRLLWTIPFTLIVASLLDPNSSTSKFFSSNLLVKIGAISYSLYLTHTTVIHVISELIPITSLASNIFSILIAAIVDLVLGTILYLLLEKPYFIRSTKKSHKKTELINKSKFNLLPITVPTVLILLSGVFIAFQSNFNLASIMVPTPKSAFGNLADKNELSMNDYQTIKFDINSSYNNMGIINVVIDHKYPFPRWENPPLLRFSLFESGDKKPLFTSDYVFDQFRGVNYPFGIPEIPDSKGKKYTILLSLTNKPVKKDYIIVSTDGGSQVFRLNKSEIITNPQMLLSILSSRFSNIISNQTALFSISLMTPFIVLLSLLSIRRRKLRN